MWGFMFQRGLRHNRLVEDISGTFKSKIFQAFYMYVLDRSRPHRIVY
jgi:hypothetical protein